MKITKIIVLIITFVVSQISVYAQNNGNSVTVSNHSISTSTLLSLEYAYEQSLGNNTTLVMRAGLPNRILFNSIISDGALLHLDGRTSLAYGITIEPRIYTSLKRRSAMGKKTLKNSSDFVTFRLQGTLGTPNYPTAEVCLVPMYGIRRVWGENWFGEFTVGGGISCHSLIGWTLNFKPHLQYRVGFIF